MGYGLERGFHDSVRARTLEDELGDAARPVLVVQLGQGPRPEIEAAAERWLAHGSSVDIVELATREVWWFLDQRAAPAEDLVRATTDWIGARLGALMPEGGA